MNRSWTTSAALIFGAIATLSAQQVTIHIQALNGVTGHPLTDQRLLIFGGETAEAAQMHRTHHEVRTDNHGVAELSVSQDETKFLLIFADYKTLCQSQSNLHSFSVETILRIGLAAPNTRRTLNNALKPGTFTLFARKPYLA